MSNIVVAWGCFKDGELQVELVGTKADVDFWVASDEPHMQGMVAGPLYATPPLLDAAVLEEREACAKVCDARSEADGWEGCYADECAFAIRARGNT